MKLQQGCAEATAGFVCSLRTLLHALSTVYSASTVLHKHLSGSYSRARLSSAWERTCPAPDGSTRYSCGPSSSHTASSDAVPYGLPAP